MMRFAPLLLAACCLLAARPAATQVPQTMSYQGVLTDGAGAIVPDGFYDLIFRIYEVPSGGAVRWTESHTGANHVQVSRGGFSTVLGSLNPLTLFFDGPLYLSIQIGADPELNPRVPLAASPYALGLRLPFTLSSTAGAPILQGFAYGSLGMALEARTPSFSPLWAIEPDADGSGAYFWLARNAISTAFLVEANYLGSGDPYLFIGGASRGAAFDMSSPDDDSVQLPANSIASGETLDESGVAQGHVNGSVSVPIGSTMGDIVTVTITTPDAGFIVVDADGQHGLGGDASSTHNIASIQIDETAGGSVDVNHYFASGYLSGPRNFFSYTPLSVHRTYFKAAGTYTFRLEAAGSQPTFLSNYIWNPTITARYYPTAYGVVQTAPALADAGQFKDRQPTSSAGNGPGQAASRGEIVDLRELEARAAKEVAEGEQAKRELAEARAAAQMDASRRPFSGTDKK